MEPPKRFVRFTRATFLGSHTHAQGDIVELSYTMAEAMVTAGCAVFDPGPARRHVPVLKHAEHADLAKRLEKAEKAVGNAVR